VKKAVATVDFNTVLACVNVVVAGLIASALWREQSNEYVDSQTLGLGLALCLQTQIALMLERTRRDPFVILLAFSNIVYYALRIYTLSVYPFSVVFDRYPYDARDSNFALVFMIVANAFLYGGLWLARSRPQLRICAEGRQANHPGGVLLIVLATFGLTYLGGRWGDSTPRGVGVLVVFLSPAIIVAMVLVYYFLFRSSLSPRFAVATFVLLILEMVAHTLLGSRSALVYFIQTLILVGLAIGGTIKLPRAAIVTGVAFLPVVVALAVASFAISTYNRAARDGGSSLSIGNAVQLAGNATSELSMGPALDVLLPPVFARAGFFDFSAEVIAHRRQYSNIINPASYAESVVDNILTPGFDVFDQPKIANSLLFAYRNWGLPSKQLAAQSDVYQSDQLGVYGEFYALFGYSCLPLLFLLSYFLKRIYMRIESSNPFMLAMQRVIVLSFFARSIDSFGVDWTIGEILPFVVATWFYAPLFSNTARHTCAA